MTRLIAGAQDAGQPSFRNAAPAENELGRVQRDSFMHSDTKGTSPTEERNSAPDATRGYGRFTYHSVNSEQRPPVSKHSTKALSYTRSTSPSALKYVLVPIATAALPSAAKHS